MFDWVLNTEFPRESLVYRFNLLTKQANSYLVSYCRWLKTYYAIHSLKLMGHKTIEKKSFSSCIFHGRICCPLYNLSYNSLTSKTNVVYSLLRYKPFKKTKRLLPMASNINIIPRFNVQGEVLKKENSPIVFIALKS